MSESKRISLKLNTECIYTNYKVGESLISLTRSLNLTKDMHLVKGYSNINSILMRSMTYNFILDTLPNGWELYVNVLNSTPTIDKLT